MLEESDLSLDETQEDDILQVSDEENAHLTAQYSEEGLKRRSCK